MGRLAYALGSAESLYEDYDAAYRMAGPGIISAANDAGRLWVGDVHYWASMHPEQFFFDRPSVREYWVIQAALQGVTVDCPPEKIRIVEPLWGRGNSSGSSGMLAVQAALENAERVILCGMPIAPGRHIEGALSDLNPNIWFDPDAFRDAWERALPWLAGRVRSMSGWTRDFLGEPTPAWIRGE